ncbi:nucleotide sugar dehydrogenase [Streptomyces sp. NPDC005529]|uniref:nucleotide sugar dehydrogenase n=1 Tax=unclassified Streptomyces TaxID=2593676 RepID=UPI0033B13890
MSANEGELPAQSRTFSTREVDPPDPTHLRTADRLGVSRGGLSFFRTPANDASCDGRSATLAVVGLGYVGLPTALAFFAAGAGVIGVDISQRRLEAISRGAVDLLPVHHAQLACAVESEDFRLTADVAEVGGADAVVICVPTPVDGAREPDLAALSAACASVVRHARAGQVIVLTSTSYVGTTRDMLIGPLAERGLVTDRDVWVAFSPERIDPGNDRDTPERTPRVVGGAGPESMRVAAALLAPTASRIHPVDCPETAEMAKLWENTYRAVNIALANELSDACRALGLAPLPVIEAAATKPYGFMPFYPGPGVGGHCIPCDPHYLRWQLRGTRQATPLIDTALAANGDRPARMVDDALRILAEAAVPADGARVLVLGIAYKPGVADIRESPALEIIARLSAAGAAVAYSDPFVPVAEIAGCPLRHEPEPDPADWDLIIVHTRHPGQDLAWLDDASRVLDTGQRRAQTRARADA